jgi:hypothetical protein
MCEKHIGEKCSPFLSLYIPLPISWKLFASDEPPAQNLPMPTKPVLVNLSMFIVFMYVHAVFLVLPVYNLFIPFIDILLSCISTSMYPFLFQSCTQFHDSYISIHCPIPPLSTLNPFLPSCSLVSPTLRRILRVYAQGTSIAIVGAGIGCCVF